MHRYKLRVASALAGAAFIMVGCGDQSGPTAPAADAVSSQVTPRFATGPGSVVTAVRWSASHQKGEYSASGTFGVLGGTLSIPKADFKLTIPPLALTKRTTVKVIALKGDFVQYDMQPHGLRFVLPVEVKQGLRNTAAYQDSQLASRIFGIYVAGDAAPAKDGSILATEILPSKTIWFLLNGLLKPDYQLWNLNHFSRYMLASG